ncbi:MAG TPA: C13 family peptidase [Burkholderiales bacterium]
MDAEESTQARAGDPVRHWLQNLGAGVRLALFRRPVAGEIRISAGHLIAITASGLFVSFACALFVNGAEGSFDLQALPSELFWLPLALLAGYLVGRLTQDERYALLIPIAIGAIGIPLTIASNAVWVLAASRAMAEDVGSSATDIVFAWWALAILVATRRLMVPGARRTAHALALVSLLVLLPSYMVPTEALWAPPAQEDVAADRAGAGRPALTEGTLYAQPALLRAAEEQLKPERPGVEDLYFVGFAPNASQDVFMKETLSIGKLLAQRFDTGGRSISLISNASLADRVPMATLTSLREALRAVGERINPDEDVVLLHLTSHGSAAHELSVEFYPLALPVIHPGDLRAALDDAGIKWRIVVISACYSGGFIDALKDERTLVIAASDANHTSFGCGDAFDYTYFSKAYYDEALRQTHSFAKAFALAEQSIHRREQQEGLEASHPQIYLGEAMKAKLSKLEKRLDAGEASAN